MFKSLLIKITGNRRMQIFLERIVRKFQYLMGIGSGTNVENSGEVRVFSLLNKSSSDKTIVFDVGANKGQFLQEIAKHVVSKKLKIFCFEPSENTFNILKNNKPGNIDIVLENKGLGKDIFTTDLYTNEEGSGIASLTKRRLDHFNVELNKKEIVRIDTIDNYCSQNNIDKIDLLKIDVEGHEYDVLVGATKMLQYDKIGIITFEFGGCNIDTRIFFQDYFYFFKNINMNLYRITPSGYLFQIKKYSESQEQFTTTNYIAFKNGCDVYNIKR